MKITYETEGVDEAIVRLDGCTERIRERIVASFEQSGPELRDAAAAGAPARAAGHRDRHPGRLRKSIKSKVTQADDSIALQVGPPIFYGSEIERGVAGQLVTVRGRRSFSRTLIGWRRRRLKSGREVIVARRGRVETRRGRSYSRRFHITAHPFIAPAWESMRDRILAGIASAVASGVDG